MTATPFTDRARGASGPTSRSSRAPCATASRSSTSTPRRPRRSPGRPRRRAGRSTTRMNSAVHRGAHQLSEEAHRAYEAARETDRRLHRRARRARSSSRRTPPSPSTSSPTRSPTRRTAVAADPRAARSARETRSSSPRWSTTRTSCRGRSWPGAPARRCAGSRSPTTGGSTSTTSAASSPSGRRVVAFTHASNVLGTVNPVAPARSRRPGPSARSSSSTPASRCRTCRSTWPTSASTSSPSPGTRCSGPLGIGVLWGRAELLDGHAAVPHRRLDDRDGDDGAAHVRRRRPSGSRPGCPMAAQAIGLAAAVDYLDRLGMDRVHAHEQMLTGRLLDGLAERPWLRRPRADRSSRRPWRSGELHRRPRPRPRRRPGPRRRGLAVRVGHHCAWPLHRRFGPRRRRGRPSRPTTPRPRSTPFFEALDPVPAFFGVDAMARRLMDLYQELILEHSQAPGDGRAARAVRRRGAPRQPHLRRRGDPPGPPRHRRRTAPPSSATSRTTPRAARSARPSTSVLAQEVIGHPLSEALETSPAMRAHAHLKGPGPRRRGGPRRRRRLRRRREVPRPGQVRPAGMDGLHRRVAPGRDRHPDRDTDGGAHDRHDHDAGHGRAPRPSVADVEEALRDVVDPELGINVVDLGLVYGITSTSTRAPSST